MEAVPQAPEPEAAAAAAPEETAPEGAGPEDAGPEDDEAGDDAPANDAMSVSHEPAEAPAPPAADAEASEPVLPGPEQADAEVAPTVGQTAEDATAPERPVAVEAAALPAPDVAETTEVPEETTPVPPAGPVAEAPVEPPSEQWTADPPAALPVEPPAAQAQEPPAAASPVAEPPVAVSPVAETPAPAAPTAEEPAEEPARAPQQPHKRSEEAARRRRWESLVAAALAEAEAEAAAQAAAQAAAEAAAPPRPMPARPAPPPPPPSRHRAPDTGAAPAVAPRPVPAPVPPVPQRLAPEPPRPVPAAAPAAATASERRQTHRAEPSGAAPVITARHGRLRRRIVLAAVVLVVLLAGGLTFVAVRSQHGTTRTAAAAPTAVLPHVGDPAPVLAALSSTAPVPDPGRLSAQLAPVLASPALGQVGAEVLDVSSGTVLLDKNGAAPATPASTAKLVTSVAALTTLDPESTLPTTVVAGATPGEVVLVGGGDPTLSRAATSANYPGAASVVDLAAQVKAALGPGVPVTRVVVDGSLYSGPLTAPGWQPGDAPSSYASPVTAVSVDGGRTSATSQNRSGTPATDAGQALAGALGVPHAPVVQGTAPAGARTLATVHSAPIARIVEQALSQSDNMLAEALARQVAIARKLPASFAGSAQAVLAALKEAGVDTSGVTLNDGSGLSRDDRVPPKVLAGLLAGVAKGTLGRASAILSGLAVAGYDGTLADRGDSDPATAPGAVRGKTGTLLGVHALAGTVVTADGRLLAYAVVANGTTAPDSATESALDKVASTLAACGCR